MKTIFVSSTFKDMHFERDAIQEITLPALRNEAMKYGESVSFCDLRWGINTGDLDSEEGSRKVLDVCLDEIDRCKPPMVVILGDRYGWIPSETLTKNAAARKKIELEDLQISVTALEIAYGALSTPERCEQALFYFRHIESECPSDYSVEDAEHEKKLNQLKAKIDQLTGGRIKHYYVRWDGSKLEGVSSFAEMLAEDIKDALLPEWKKKEFLTPFERERLTHWSFITEKNEMFSARSALVQKYYDDLTQNGKHFLAIKAPSGSGKSMLFSNLALKLRDSGYDVVPFMSGLTAESNDSMDILRNTIYYMEDLLGFSHESVDLSVNRIDSSAEFNGEKQKEQKSGIDKLRERLLELCVECEQTGKRVIIMVDAVDQLASDDNRDNLIFIPERLSKNVEFVMTCLPELNVSGYECETLDSMDVTEKRLVVIGILGAHHRQLEDSVVEKMLELKASSNPLFLSLLIQRLLMMNYEDFFAINAKQMNAMKAISERQMEVLENCPDSLQEMSATLLAEAGKRINEDLVREVAEYLAVSRYGLRQEDLATLLGEKWSALDFAHFITYMNESFMQRDDGRFDFSHKCVREGVLRSCTDEEETHRQLLSYLQHLPTKDAVKMKETVYHCLKANDTIAFVNFISEYHNSSLQNNYAMKDVYDFSALDNGEWILRVLSELTCDTTNCVSEFISIVFNRYGNSKQLEISKKILEKNIEIITGKKDTQTDPQTCLSTSLAYYQFAELCGMMGGNECWQERYDAYTKSITELNAAKEFDNSIDIRFALSQRLESIGNLYKEREEQHNIALDYYKQATAIREELFSENISEQYRTALSNAYLSIGKLYSLYTSNVDYLWNAISYFDHALSLTATLSEDPAFFEQRAVTYHSIAKVYREKGENDKNMQKAYNNYHKAITYYEKLLWKNSPQDVWLAMLNCYNEQAILLLGIVNKIDEEGNKIVKAMQSWPFDPSKRNEYIQESINCFQKALYYHEKLNVDGYDNIELSTVSAKILYMLAGATILASGHRSRTSEDYLVKGKQRIHQLKNTLSNAKLFAFYYDIYMLFENMSVKNHALRYVASECLNCLNGLLPTIKDNADIDRESIMHVEMYLSAYSKQYGKMLSYIPKLLIEALKVGLSHKEKKLKSNIRNDVDRRIKKSTKNNIFAHQSNASSSVGFAIMSIIGNCIILPCKYLLRLLTPLLLKVTDNSRALSKFILWYDGFTIFASLLLLGLGLYACVFAIRSKKSALRTAIMGVALSIISILIVLSSLNGSNYFEKKYNNAIALMDDEKYVEAIEIFESLHDYEDSEVKKEACATAILDQKYEYAIHLMNEGKIVEAYDMLVELNDHKGSDEVANSIYETYQNELLISAQVGDYIYYGTYEQDNYETNGKEKIEWLVLDKHDGKLLVISKHVLDCQAYNTFSGNITWEASTLRSWLNSDFLNTAFSNNEREKIATMVISNDNSQHGTDQGSVTHDKVFVLSIPEAKKYFASNEMRKCQATNYAKSLGASRAGCSWWLRTIGRYQNYACHTWQIGGINDLGVCVNENDIGVRPAMWIELP